MRKIILFTTIFLSGALQIFAFDVGINLDKSSVDINDNIYLTLEVSNIGNGEVISGVNNIPGIENFDVISTNQSQSFSSKQIIINGKLTTEGKQVLFLKFGLRAKNNGNFVIGPITLSNGTETKKTNSVNINIDGKKIISTQNNTQNLQIPIKELSSKKELIHDKNFNKKLFTIENIIKIIVVGLAISGILILIILSRNNKNSKKDEDKNDNKKQEEKIIKKENIEIPDIDDKDFIENLEKYVKLKLRDKYKLDISKILNLKDMIKNEKLSLIDKENLEKIIQKLDIMKYSNLVNSKTELIKIVEKI